MNDKTLHKLTYGLFVLTASENGKNNGCIINTAVQAASDPLTITICVNKANYTHDMILNTRKFNLSILSENAEFGLFKRFGFQSGRDTDKFDGFFGYRIAGNEVPIITQGTNAYLCGWVVDTVDLGSHTMFIARVADMDILNDAPSTTYVYYLNHIKPQPKKDDAPKGKVVWRCTICGYIYDGDPIPEDFICPICKHPASDFERVEG